MLRYPVSWEALQAREGRRGRGSCVERQARGSKTSGNSLQGRAGLGQLNQPPHDSGDRMDRRNSSHARLVVRRGISGRIESLNSLGDGEASG